MFSNFPKTSGMTAWLAMLAAMLTAAPASAQQAPPPPAVTVMDIKPQTVPLSFQYAARISAYSNVEVRARVGGILLKRNFIEGSEVQKGDVLFNIDPAPYEAALAQAKAQLQQAQAQLDQARREETRATSLFDQKVGSEKSRDDAISSRELAEASVAAAKATVQTAELNLGYTSVTAPISGITSLQQVPEGSLLSTSEFLTSITQLDPVYVNFSFSDSEAAEVRHLLDMRKAKGEEPKLTVDISFGDGTEYDKKATVDFTSSSIDVETGTLQARAIVANPEKRLLPGQFVRATVTGVSLDDAILIPEVALMQGAQGQFVYTVGEDGNAKISPVTLGRKVAEGWIVDSGLKAGDKLIVEGIIKVRPGGPVQPTPAAGAEKVAESK